LKVKVGAVAIVYLAASRVASFLQSNVAVPLTSSLPTLNDAVEAIALVSNPVAQLAE
jgi:hypothetical protein